MIYESYIIGGELYHHGILGQKWGKRNGPPYPLKATAHSKSEIKSDYKKSIGGGRNENLYERNRVTKNINKQSGVEEDFVGSLVGIGVLSAILVAPYISDLIKKGKNKRLNKKAEQKLEEIRNNKKGKIDPKTGFHMKNKDTSVEDDLKHVNPAHSTSENTNNNCVYCSATLEMRRRGYDVTANLSSDGMNGRKVITDLFPGAKVNNIDTYDIMKKGKDPRFVELDMTRRDKIDMANLTSIMSKDTQHAKNVISTLSKEKNSRGCLLVTWGFGGGHAINYEVTNGNVRILDSQTGKTFSGKSAEELLSTTILASSIRLDNVDFDPNKIKKVMQ